MIDTDVERGTFFHSHVRVVKKDNRFRYRFIINAAKEYRSLLGDGIIIEIEEENADSEFVRQVKIKLGIVAADAYF